MDNVYNFIDGVISFRDYARLSLTDDEYRKILIRRREREYEELCRNYLETARNRRTDIFSDLIKNLRLSALSYMPGCL